MRIKALTVVVLLAGLFVLAPTPMWAAHDGT